MPSGPGDRRRPNGAGSGQGALDDHLPRVDPKSQAARLAYWTNVLAELDKIPTAELSPGEQINAVVFRTAVEIMANEVRYKLYEIPFNTDTFSRASVAPRPGQDFGNAE